MSRIIFFLANRSYFPEAGFADVLKDCFFGLRFDSFSIVISNSLFILLSILPFDFYYKSWYQKLLKWLFVICNSIFVLANFVDAGYFPFIRKRSTFDLFKQIGGQSDLAKLLPQFIRDFWWVALSYVLFVAAMIYLYNRIRLNYSKKYPRAGFRAWAGVLLLFLFVGGLSVLAARGGLQRVPIDIVNAGSVTSPEQVPVVLNTPFTLIKSVNQQAVKEYHYFKEEELKRIFNPVHRFRNGDFRKQNVVVLILESFSKEYTRLSHLNSITPFLDSLMGKSLVFTNAFSNGTKSIEGIPAILSSLPSLMENPFINSVYATNKQTSLANLLAEEGYETAFFHGGINGTMNFEDWAASAGYKRYFGKNEYNNDDDFDNFWGIWDEPFLQYSVKKMNEFTEPFHSAIFTLSSHHPYFVPSKYKNRFKKGKLENSQSIEYADYALSRFFDTAKKTKWYANTLFVLTADHTSLSESHFYTNWVGSQSIPILFFRPDNSLTGENAHVFSQMDILPSTMDLLGYNKPFFALGRSYRSEPPDFAYYYVQGTYFLYNDSTVFFYNDDKLNSVFNYRRDSLLTNNLAGKSLAVDTVADKQYKVFIQTYNNMLIGNSGSLK